MVISPREVLSTGAHELGITLSDHQLDQFDALTALLLDWNDRFNLTRITDPIDITTKHYLDSLSILPHLKVAHDAYVIDVGTGAGIPGIPLKIVLPGIHLALLDSLKKKLTFAETVVQELGMTEVEIVHARAEDVGRDKARREKFDIVISRAVASLPVLAELCLPLCRVHGRFVAYKGPEPTDEIKDATGALRTLGGRLESVHELTLPHSDYKRTIVIIEKIRPTPLAYPRQAGIPAKTPLL